MSSWPPWIHPSSQAAPGSNKQNIKARDYLSIPATSMPLEQKAGSTITIRIRNRLWSERLDIFLFISDSDFCKVINNLPKKSTRYFEVSILLWVRYFFSILLMSTVSILCIRYSVPTTSLYWTHVIVLVVCEQNICENFFFLKRIYIDQGDFRKYLL